MPSDVCILKLYRVGKAVFARYKKNSEETEAKLIEQFTVNYGRKIPGQEALEWHVDLEIVKLLAEGIWYGKLNGFSANGAESLGTRPEEIEITATGDVCDFGAASLVIGYFFERALKFENYLLESLEEGGGNPLDLTPPLDLLLITIGLIESTSLLKSLRHISNDHLANWEHFCQSRAASMDTKENFVVPGAFPNNDGAVSTKDYSDEEDMDVGNLKIDDAEAGPVKDDKGKGKEKATAVDDMTAEADTAAPRKGKKKRKNRKRKGKAKAQATDDDAAQSEPDLPPSDSGKGKGKAKATDLPAYVPGPNTPSVPDDTSAGYGPGPALPSDNGEGPSTAAPSTAAVDPITRVAGIDAGLEKRKRPLTKKAAHDRITQHLNDLVNADYPSKEARRAALARAHQQIMHSETLAAARGEQRLRPTAPRNAPPPVPHPLPAPGGFRFGTLPGWEGELEAMMIQGMRRSTKKPEDKKSEEKPAKK